MKRGLLSVLLCLTVQATIVPSLSLEELIDGSEIIVHGRVARSWTAWDSGHKYIWTHHELDVIDPIRGARSGRVVVSEPGGTLDGVAMKFSGALPFSAGEETVVFLYRTPIGYLRTSGYGQGKYTVAQDTRVSANLRGLDVARRGPARGIALSTLEGLTVADFKARVRGLMRTTR